MNYKDTRNIIVFQWINHANLLIPGGHFISGGSCALNILDRTCSDNCWEATLGCASPSTLATLGCVSPSIYIEVCPIKFMYFYHKKIMYFDFDFFHGIIWRPCLTLRRVNLILDSSILSPSHKKCTSWEVKYFQLWPTILKNINIYDA
jgi:hypothetical protein